MRRTDAAFGLALLLSSLALTGCTLGHADSGAPQAGGRGAGDGQAVPITVGRVVQKPVPLQLQVIGTVEPSSTVAIRAQITSELTSVTFKEGDDVREGQLLFTFDQRPLEAALKQAEANLAA